MKILVCGDRDWTDKELIRKELSDWYKLFPDLEIIQGGCQGVDIMAKECCYELGIPCETFEADWVKYGKSAGPIRNRKMLDQKPDLVLAFHSHITKSKGTKDCIFEANRRGIEVRIIPGGN